MNEITMNCYIPKNDARIIRDALNHYAEWIRNDDHAPALDSFPYMVDDIDGLIGVFTNWKDDTR
jgi:hypothetical protein